MPNLLFAAAYFYGPLMSLIQGTPINWEHVCQGLFHLHAYASSPS